MVSYKCNTCNKIFFHKNDFRKHLNKKKTCSDENKIYSQPIPQNGKKNDPYFRCPVCDKTFTRRYNLNRHIYSCCPPQSGLNSVSNSEQPILNDSETSDSYSLTDSEILQTPCFSEGIFYSAKIPPKTTKKRELLRQKPPAQNVMSSQIQMHLYRCVYCSKTFSRHDSLSRHISERCDIKKKQDSEKERIFQKLIQQMEKQHNEIKKLQEQNSELKTKISGIKITKNIKGSKISIKNTDNRKIINNTQNNFNNIKLVAFGQEDLSYITDHVNKRMINKGFQSVPKLVEFVHFNKNKPEHHNVYISNMRDNYAMIFDGKKWRLNDRTEVIDQLMDDKKFYLLEKFDELIEYLDEPTIKKFKRYIEQQDDENVKNNIKKEIKFILYNNKNISENTRRLLCDAVGEIIDDNMYMIEDSDIKKIDI